MAVADSDVQMATHRAPEHDEPAEPGWTSRWIQKDPVRAAACLMMVLALAWRADIASRGFLAVDDFVIASRAAETDLSADFLLGLVNNHLMPAGLAIYWLVTRAASLAYWPYVLLLLAGQAAVSVAFYRLLCRLVRPGWPLLIPLGIFVFSPLTLEATSWWVVGVNMLPMQLAMVLAIGAQVKYVRTGRARHLATLGLSVVFGLLFFEKSLLIVPLVFLTTACLFATGGLIRSVGSTIRRFWPSWLVLGVISAGYLRLYLSRAESSLRVPLSGREVVTFGQQFVGSALVPGLLGGPWEWANIGDFPPLAAPSDLARMAAWIMFLGLVVATVRIRPPAGRAWWLLATYVALAVGLLAATRLGAVLSAAAGLTPRYVSDVVVVAALCTGVALSGLRDSADQGHARAQTALWPKRLQEPGALGVGLVVALVMLALLGAGAGWSGARFGDIWAVKQGREYLETARADLATAPPGTVFFDATVPEGVVTPFAWPYNLQSHFFRPVNPRPVFVTEAEKPSIFDNTGHIRPLRIEGTATLPGPDGDCGYKITDGQSVRMPLATNMFEWPWVVRVGYLSSGDSTAVLRFGTATHQFRVHSGLNQLYFVLQGHGNAVELTINDPTVAVCSDGIMVGNAQPQQ